MPTLTEYADLLKPALTEAAAELEQAEAEVEAAQAKVKVAKAKSRQVEIAMSALKGGDRAAGQQRGRKSRSNDWTPRESTLRKVREAIKLYPDGFTEEEIMNESDLSDATTNRSINVLRDRREIRLVGKKAGTQKNLYKPIVVPETAEAAVA